jgi:hypothetical protein
MTAVHKETVGSARKPAFFPLHYKTSPKEDRTMNLQPTVRYVLQTLKPRSERQVKSCVSYFFFEFLSDLTMFELDVYFILCLRVCLVLFHSSLLPNGESNIHVGMNISQCVTSFYIGKYFVPASITATQNLKSCIPCV